MSLPRYPDYRDSGADWLGFIPAHWCIQPLKHGADFVNGCAFKPEQWEESGTPIIRIENLNGSLSFNYVTGDVDARYHVDEGDLLFGWSGNRGTSFGPFLWPHAGKHYLNQHIFRICNFKFFKSWFYWTLKAVTSHVEDQAHGIIGMVHVTKGELGAIKVPVPPIAEQTAIATFLDRETAKIDTLIAEQEKLLTLLAEKRQATISHAVTKGLNPDAPMKDSGVEWLGEVPVHWLVGKTGFYISVLPGYAFPSAAFSLDESNVKLLRGINVGVGELRWDEVVFWERAENDGLEAFELCEGDVVIGMDRPLISTGMRVAVVKDSDLPCLLLQRVAKIQAGPSIDSRFVMRLLSSRAFEAHFTPETTGVSVPHISGEQILSFVIPVPPLDEQQKICDFLESELASLDALNNQSELAIDLLKERRTTLISAAVTGKIDVRHLAKQEAA